MALFEVPGWSVPSAPIAGPSADSHPRKRKRNESEKEESKLQSAAVNVEKLMATLGAMGGAGEDGSQPKRAKKGKGKRREEREETAGAGDVKEGGKATRTHKTEYKERKETKKGEKGVRKPRETAAETAADPPVQSQDKPGKKQKKKRRDSDANVTKSNEHESELSDKPNPPPQSRKSQSAAEDGLTTMQARMKQSLDGARFRCVHRPLVPCMRYTIISQVDQRDAVQVKQRARTRHDAREPRCIHRSASLIFYLC